CSSLALAELLKVLLGVLALVARERHVFEGVGFFGERGLNLFLDRLERFARFVWATRIADANAFAGFGVGGDAGVVLAGVGLLFRSATFTLTAFVWLIGVALAFALFPLALAVG